MWIESLENLPVCPANFNGWLYQWNLALMLVLLRMLVQSAILVLIPLLVQVMTLTFALVLVQVLQVPSSKILDIKA